MGAHIEFIKQAGEEIKCEACRAFCLFFATSIINRGSYRSAHVLLNLVLLSWGKEIKCEACQAFYRFFPTSLINTIIQEHKC